MKRARVIPSILMLILSVALLAVGVYASTPTSSTIGGIITITAGKAVADVTAYVDGTEVGAADTFSDEGIAIEQGKLQFDLSDVSSIDDVDDIEIKVKIQNNSSKPIGAFFYSGNGTLSDNLTDASCVATNGTVEDSSGTVLANIKMSGYTYIAPADSTSDYDVGYLYAVISVAELFTSEASGLVTLDLHIEEYTASSTGTLVKLATGTTSVSASSITNTSALMVVMPTSVTSISASAFASCTALTQITIPASVTSMGATPFNGCSSIARIVVEAHSASGSFGSSATLPTISGKSWYLNNVAVTSTTLAYATTVNWYDLVTA